MQKYILQNCKAFKYLIAYLLYLTYETTEIIVMRELQMVLNYALRKVMLGRSHIQLEACLQNGQRHQIFQKRSKIAI